MTASRQLPSVDRLLQGFDALIAAHGRPVVTACIRAELAASREGLRAGRSNTKS